MNIPIPVAFEITRHSQTSEQIRADSVEIEGSPEKYIFRRDGAEVFDIFVHALEREPKPIYPRTAEQKVASTSAWKAFVQKQNASSETPYLDRS